jgi:pimeloyl-ACP methyl ester carboxylesterase
MNANEIAWVSGWASDISLWENSIYERFPSFSHRFVDYFDLLPNPDEFWDNNRRVGAAALVVGWSLGTLALLRNLHKMPVEQKLVLVCPIANFCAKGCWQLSAVRATKQGILQNTEQTLMSFSALMGNMEKEEREKWVENAMRYSPNQLAIGLDYLMQKKADISGLASNAKLIFGEQDRVVPLVQKELFSSSFNKENVVVCENSGHWLPDYFKQLAAFSIFPKYV